MAINNNLSVDKVRYLDKDFISIRDYLINLSKTYYPNTYNDFNESSPGMMIMEMIAAVGDNLNFYLDKQLQESLLPYANERNNVLALANTLGYRVKNKIPAKTKIDIFQLVPSKPSNDYKPDWDYAFAVKGGMSVSDTKNNVNFITDDDIDFRFSSSFSPTEVSIYQLDGGNTYPEYYLLKKSINATAGTIKSTTFVFNSTPQKYQKSLIEDDNIISILNVSDSAGNTWREVPYLAQDTILVDDLPTTLGDPYILRLQKVNKRFISKIRADKNLEIQFGSGVSSIITEEIIPNPDNVGFAFTTGVDKFNKAYDPSNFLFTNSYGEVPLNTTLYVDYLVGGGIDSNVSANTLTQINKANIILNETGLSSNVVSLVKRSIACTNPTKADGGKEYEEIEDIKQNSYAYFAAQDRVVGLGDWIIRTYAMPPKFGSVAKVYLTKDDQTGIINNNISVANPLALNMYVLSYDINGNLTNTSDTIKNNLKTYLSYYKILTDSVNIRNGNIINVGVNFEITVLPKYNNKEILLLVINTLQQYFNIKKWSFNRPIFISDIKSTIASVKGVQSVINVEIINKYDTTLGYSGNVYDISNALRNDVVYPSLDPSIFEVKYPEKDITGRVVNY